MSLRSFTVFQDAPTETTKTKTTGTLARLARSSSLNTENMKSSESITVLVVDKENVHPLTGERSGPGLNATNKKRKTQVLATKAYLPPTKLQKELNDSQPETKKRKSNSTKIKSMRKDGKSSTKKSNSKRSSRKVSPMPKLDEETETDRERLSQADIDSRCYELTVKPLADVSRAYEQGFTLNDLVSESKGKIRTIKDSSVEPEIRDYFTPSHSLSSMPSMSRLRTPSEEPQEGRTFSTPERKQIYAAFTFSSPSPTSQRMSKISPSGSITPLADLA